MSDDVSMGALSGTIAERTRAALAAGCDLVLHCNGNLDEMGAVAAETPVLSGLAGKRAAAALGALRPASDIDLSAERKRFAELMDSVAVATRVAGS
jgi:beta-N-acetylhexosaminidase